MCHQRLSFGAVSPTLVVYYRYETKSRDSVQQYADTTLKSVLCQPQADVGRQRRHCVGAMSASADVICQRRMKCQSNVGLGRTSDADVGVVSALADVGRQRQRCVGAVSVFADVGVVSVQCRTWADVNGQHFCYPSAWKIGWIYQSGGKSNPCATGEISR